MKKWNIGNLWKKYKYVGLVVLAGILLMLLYSVGHSTLVMVAGTSVGFVQKINSSETYNRATKIVKLLMGMVILLIGLYMFWIAF